MAKWHLFIPMELLAWCIHQKEVLVSGFTSVVCSLLNMRITDSSAGPTPEFLLCS